jgi:uracil-DNA glycosylase
MDVKIEKQWKEKLSGEFDKDYFVNLVKFLHMEKAAGKTIYPPGSLIFNAFALTPFNDVKVVILGQDPYHGPNQAHGLSFSVPDGIPAPPSLKNIYKEIESDLGVKVHKNGNLENWAKQGVLLLNNVLTVKAHEANSHKGKGWEYVTDKIVEKLNEREEGVIFIFWGNNAKSKQKLINNPNHIVLTAPHPSPLSAYHGFFGCGHFSKINEILKEKGMEEINWQI